MASAILHIKDTYYFEVPKSLRPVRFTSKSDFVDYGGGLWMKLDDQFQLYEAEILYNGDGGDHPGYKDLRRDAMSFDELRAKYTDWKHDHANAGKPFDRFLEEEHDVEWFSTLSAQKQLTWESTKHYAGSVEIREQFARNVEPQWAWSEAKFAGYNKHLSGKILIPQPFGELRNFYEKESGLCISKFMILEVIVALLLFGAFSWLARRIGDGERPVGRLWNFLEVFVVYIRDQIAKPAIGEHDAARFTPLLLTMFFFILGCNLSGMIPWLGAPTGAFGTTFGMACVTFGTVLVFGVKKFGPFGFILNQIPSMELPLVLAVVIKPMLLAIELLGLCIKHAVLSIRLLANMVAGHIVLLALMALAFSVEGAASSTWGYTAIISIAASTLFSCLELFVAFLQAYVFTFLSALFIGAAIHHH